MKKGLVILFFCSIELNAQPVTAHFQQIKDGLSSLNTNSVTTDSKGFVWVSTANGLNRYNGYEFQNFYNNPADSTSLISNSILSLYYDGANRLWIGTAKGVCRYLSGNNFKQYNDTNIQYVYGLYMLQNRELLLADHGGVFVYDSLSDKWERWKYTVGLRAITCITEDNTGAVWLGNYNNKLYKLSPDKKLQEVKIPFPPVIQKKFGDAYTRLYADKRGDVWISTYLGGLIHYSIVKGKYTFYYRYPNNEEGPGANVIFRVAEDEDGKIWAANASAGVSCLNSETGKFIHYNFSRPVNEFGFYANYVNDVHIDTRGNIWVASSSGLLLFDKRKTKFSSIKVGLSEEYYSAVISVAALRKEYYLLGSERGLLLVNGVTGSLENISAKAGIRDKEAITDIIPLNKNSLIVITDKRVVTIDAIAAGNGLIFRHKAAAYKNFKGTWNANLHVMNGDSVIMMNTWSNGCFLYNIRTAEWKHFDVSVKGYDNSWTGVISSTPMRNKTYWIETRNAGLAKLNTATGEVLPIAIVDKSGKLVDTKDAALLDLYYDGKDRVWAGTIKYGLWEIDTTGKLIKEYAYNEGLYGTRIDKIVADNSGYLWLHASSGLVRFNLRDKKFTTFTSADGIANHNTIAGLAKHHDGKILFYNQGKILWYAPGIIEKSGHSPVTYITSIGLPDTTIMPEESILYRFSYKNNTLSFTFTAINYTNTSLTQYACRLEGIDKDWRQLGTSRTVLYSNLSPGKYTFEVKACDSNGIWNDNPASLSFIINTPFYKAWWFYLLCAAGIASFIYYLYMLKINRIRSEEQIRNKIARDLHDDIGSTLSGINLYSKMALSKNEGDNIDVKQILQKIEQRTGNMMEAMSDIVWSINPHHDTVADMLVRMKEYAGEILEAKEIAYQFVDGDNISSQKLSLDIRKEIFLIFKEAVNNAAKHACCKTVVISITTAQGSLILRVTDDGKGIADSIRSSGNGLKNMKERAVQIKGSLMVESVVRKGTMITLRVPIT